MYLIIDLKKFTLQENGKGGQCKNEIGGAKSNMRKLPSNDFVAPENNTSCWVFPCSVRVVEENRL